MHLKGASVVPFFRSHGQIYLVLGRERGDTSWSGSTRWSGFGGTALEDETPMRAAGREFAEESMHMPCFRDLETELVHEDFALKVVSHTPRHYYVTYVKEMAMEWPECLRHASTVRRYAACIARTPATDHPYHVVADGCCLGDGMPMTAEEVRHFQAQRVRDAALCALCEYCPQMCGFHDATLEKDLIACWSLDELRAALRCGARKTFRRCFVPTLHKILDELS